MKSLLKICNYFIWGLWRFLLLTIGAIFFFGAWFWPVLHFEENSLFTDIWISTYAFIVFYGLAMWHVVSEDERDVSLWIKMRQGILISFNKMLFAFITLAIYIFVVGTINGEL